MKKILITGCNGQLGRALRKEYAEENVEFINTDVAGDGIVPLDITSVEEVLSLVEKEKPDVVINCAAHTNVDACESQWDLAYQINAIGPRNLAIACEKTGAKLIHVSTDYVFPGTCPKPLTEFDAPEPISAYGKTKYEGELFVKEFSRKHFILRTAWLYGEGKNFVKTMLRLGESHEEITVVSDQFGSPTSAVELAKMIHFLEPTENYGTYHATCEGQCSWADFAVEIFRRAGKSTKVKYITTEEYNSPAKRPAYSILDNYMLRLVAGDKFKMADWKDALDAYFASGVLEQ
ncbi:MAG: dTDP-4-dehydrorhamnose reductase [Lachnospiraceae bacterium]|nr:dTDP-4-dehydrorhamnose reductase [Lachnospiraceae bacterium]MDE6980600.1 dTDP-4-dehydrorhamnose reductase [Lachnospiraceae bacterium]